MSMFSDSKIRDEEMDVDPSRLQDASMGSEHGAGHGQTGQLESKPFTVTLLSPNSPLGKQIPIIFNQLEMRTLDALPRSFSSTIIISTPPEEEEEEDVSEEFVNQCNDHIGNEKNLQKAWRLLRKMRIKGGLEPSNETIDISAARKGLCILTALDNHKLKIAALDSLVEILEKDEVTDESGEDIVKLGIALIERMNRNHMQTEKIKTQKKFARAYNSVAELIQRQYGRKDIGGITQELRTELIKTARKLEDLNTHEDPELHYIVESALEGIKRLRDDRKELFELLDKIYRVILVGAAVYFQSPEIIPDQLEKVFDGIDPRLQHAWYDGVFVLDALAKKAVDDFSALKNMQALIKSKYNKLDWKFLFGAIKLLERLAIQGSTSSIQQAALKGHKKMEADFPGIDYFIDCHHFSEKLDVKPVVHFSMPRFKDPNLLIREACIRSLFNIIAASHDSKMRFHAKMTILEHLNKEKDKQIIDIILSELPESLSQKYQIEHYHSLSIDPCYSPGNKPRRAPPPESSFEQAKRDWLEEVDEFVFKPLPPILLPAVEKPGDPPSQIRRVASAIFLPTVENLEQLLPGLSANPPSINPVPAPGNHSPPKGRSLSPRPSKTLKRLAEILSTETSLLQGKIKTRAGMQLIENDQIQISDKGIKDLYAILRNDKSIHTLNLTKLLIPLDGLYMIINGIGKTGLSHIILSDHETKESAKILAAAVQNSRTLLLSSQSANSYLLLGSALLTKREFAESINYLSKGIQLEEGSPTKIEIHMELLIKRGRAKLLNNNKTGAFSDFTKAIELAPDHFKGAFEIAKFYLEQEDLTNARLWGEKALAINPSNPKAQYLVSLCENKKT